MSPNKLQKSLLQHLLIILGFVALSYAYFNPVLLGKDLPQMDDTHTKGASHELVEYEKQHPGEHPMWTNAMFGGMPSYLIKGCPSFNIYHSIQPYIRLFLPYKTVAILFLLLLGFYLLLISLGTNMYLSLAGAMGFAFASFNIMIIGVGHITQAYAISFVPMVAAGILMMFNKKYLWGGLLTTFSLGIEISFSHPQITYYCFLTISILYVIKFIYAIIEKELKHFFIVSCISVLAVILAVLPNIVNLWTTYEYGKYSMRGGSELTPKNTEKKSTGLEKDYALSWSYGIAETFSVLVPEIKGAGVKGFKEDSKTAAELQKIVKDPESVAASFPVYWGDLPWTDATIYFGAIICFLFIFGLFVTKGPEKWWLLTAAVLSFCLAWGKYFPLVTNFFFDHFPGYNKFRTVEMILVIANFAFPLLGFLALKNVFEGKIHKDEALKALKYSLIVVGGLLLIFILIPGMFFDFKSANDEMLKSQLTEKQCPINIINDLLSAMRNDRESILRSDALRSLIFIAIAAGLIWVLLNKKLKTTYFSFALASVILIDMWIVDRRDVNKDRFVSKSDYQNQITLTLADEYILKDPDPNYRVLNLAQNIFNDAYTPYFHKSIGGYHGAKMRRYQDLIEKPLSSDLMRLQSILQSHPTFESLSESLKGLPILNMLNTKYIIYNPETQPIINTAAMGNAWFVKEIRWANGPDEEYAALNNFDPVQTAIIDKRFENIFTGIEPLQTDTSARIKLLTYAPDHLEYLAQCHKSQLAVFSEIFYDKGWNAYIDGKLAPHGRANYVLRTMLIPAGEHKIEFKFEPRSYYIGQKIALASSSVMLLFVIFVFWDFIKKRILTNNK